MHIIKVCFFLSLLFTITACLEPATPQRNTDDGNRDNDGDRVVTRPPGTIDTETSDYLFSQSYRNRGAKIRTYNQERDALIKGANLSSYRAIPSDNDHDERAAVFQHSLNNCGVSDAFITLKERYEDCKAKNEGTSFWSGKTNGVSGEGDWVLILKNSNITIMQDLRTSLLWTTIIENNEWKNASGRNQELAEDETDQNVCTDLKIKAMLSDQVAWRLPTRSEFLQADINGSRFVLSQSNVKHWTASTDAKNMVNAWAIIPQTGVLSSEEKTDSIAVRCVGYALK